MQTSVNSLVAWFAAIAMLVANGCSRSPDAAVAVSTNKDLVQQIIEARREFDNAMISAVDVKTAMAAKTVMLESYDKMRNAVSEMKKFNKLALDTGTLSKADFQMLDKMIRDEQEAAK